MTTACPATLGPLTCQAGDQGHAFGHVYVSSWASDGTHDDGWRDL